MRYSRIEKRKRTKTGNMKGAEKKRGGREDDEIGKKEGGEREEKG